MMKDTAFHIRLGSIALTPIAVMVGMSLGRVAGRKFISLTVAQRFPAAIMSRCTHERGFSAPTRDNG